MAIAFDNSLARTNGTTSVTVAFTITGTDTAIVVTVEHTGTISSVTYAGTNLTKVGTVAAHGGIGEALTSWILVGTSTGSNNIIATCSAGADVNVMAVSYTGVNSGGGTGGSDASNTASLDNVSGNQTLATTTASDNAWIVLGVRSEQAASVVTNVTYRQSTADVATIGDTNAAITPAGSTNQTINTTVSGDLSMVSVALKPAGGAVAYVQNNLTLLGVS